MIRYLQACTRSVAVSVAAILLAASTAKACNVPVFRYALERWQSEPATLVVFHRGPLDAEQQSLIEQLRSQTTTPGGARKYDITQHNVDEALEPDLKSLWDSAKDEAELPLVVILSRASRVEFWRGPLTEAGSETLLASPALEQIAQRILKGNTVVWLELRGSDTEQADKARSVLEEQLKRLEQEVSLPDGIGLPGSKLYSDVPLEISFSIVEVDASDPREEFLVKLLTSLSLEAVVDGETLFVPVFGRGRALEVLPGSALTRESISELTDFLCGVCSCTVKEINPGFDLPIGIDWESSLFRGEVSTPIHLLPLTEKIVTKPVKIAIPPGNKLEDKAASVVKQTTAPLLPKSARPVSQSATQNESDQQDRFRYSTVAIVAIICLAVALFVRYRIK